MDTNHSKPQMTAARRAGVAVFLLIAFGAAWSYWLGAYLLGFSLLNPLAQLPGAFSPALAALIARKWVSREGFRDAGFGLRLKQSWPYYLVAWFGPVAVIATAAVLAATLGLWSLDLSPFNEVAPGLPGWAFLPLLICVAPLMAPVFWGEDFGWNSFLLQRIFTGRPHLAVLATGLIWAVWHYPLAFLGYTEYANVYLGLLGWTIGIMLQQIAHAWLRVRSGSIWPVSIWHAGNNLIISLLTEMLFPEVAEGVVTLLVAGPMVLICAWILLTRQFAGGVRGEAACNRLANSRQSSDPDSDSV
jgi:uncharacterized protein